MAGVRGLEPRNTVLETAVLILLDYTPIGAGSKTRTYTNQGLGLIPLPIGLYQHDNFTSLCRLHNRLHHSSVKAYRYNTQNEA